MVDLSGKKIMITGASSGIGRAVAILVSICGATVVACGRNEPELDKTLMLCADDKPHKKICFDVKNIDVYDKIFNDIVSDGLKLDGLVHSAGIATPTPLRVLNANIVYDILNVNLVSFIHLTALFSKKKYSNEGSIVSIGAVNAHYPQKCMSVYAASKAALEGATRSMAIELADRNIRINCVLPGGVKTPMANNTLEETSRYLNQKMLLGIAEPKDIANMVVFLLSDAAKKITGRSMYVDSGWLGQ